MARWDNHVPKTSSARRLAQMRQRERAKTGVKVGRREVYEPNEEQMKVAIAEIQSTWDEDERERRCSIPDSKSPPVEIPFIKGFYICLRS